MRLRHFFLVLTCCAVLSSKGLSNPAFQYSPARQEAVWPATRPALQDGDIIFIRSNKFLFRRVAQTCQSWESHVGMLFADPGGNWWVAESILPISKWTPLKRFLARSYKGRFVVKRARGGLSAEEQAELRQAAQSRMGQWYDLGFNYDSPRLYCSKFVHDAYLQSTGIEVGHLETFQQLLRSNPKAPMSFWRMWFFGSIPWERRCITTTSILNSENLETVMEFEAAPPSAKGSQMP